jgi:hypothetical protein
MIKIGNAEICYRGYLINYFEVVQYWVLKINVFCRKKVRQRKGCVLIGATVIYS